ncbi:hypothetical protein [Archangium sp.]|uniref:hypothetical protein n=1 Tax=Archangium sp. TaxID=1872627 RepID=UPI0038998415
MSRIVIINGSSDPDGYWANEVRANTLLLLTHRAGAKQLALTWGRQEPIYWYRTGGIGFFGPLTLLKWDREKDFFRLHFVNIDKPARPLSGRNAAAGERVHRELKKMRHFIICQGAEVDYVNMEHPTPSAKHPSPVEVEDALREAGVPSAE